MLSYMKEINISSGKQLRKSIDSFQSNSTVTFHKKKMECCFIPEEFYLIRQYSAVKLTDVMTDLSTTTFFVPLVDRCSPLAYSIVNEIHWEHEVANHTGIETVLRYIMKVAYILEGRELVKQFRKSCERCRYLLYN